MEFHQLRYFVAAAEELSMTRASERLHVSQPALSRQIAALEEELGVPLFDRVRKRIHLTAAGRFLLPKARRLLCDAETTIQQLKEQYGEASRSLRVGLVPTFLDDIVVPAVKGLRREMPRLNVQYFELGARAQMDRLRDGDLDLALVGNMLEDDRQRFVVKCLARARMAAVLPEDHRLASRKQIALRELEREPHVSLSDVIFPGRREFLIEIFRSQGFLPEIVEECDSLSLLLAQVSTGVGVALLPHHCRKLPHTGSVFVKLRAPIVYAEVIAVSRKEESDPLIDLLIGKMESAATLIVEL